MGVFNEIGRKMSNAGQKTMQKTKDFADITKYSAAIGDEEKKIAGIYRQIGELYYEKYKTDPNADFPDLIAAVTESVKQIENLNLQIQGIKKVKKCTNCGKEIATESAFCAYCGAPVAVEAPKYKFCGNCGQKISPDSEFCFACGSRVSGPEEPKAEIVADAVTETEETPSVQPETDRLPDSPEQS